MRIIDWDYYYQATKFLCLLNLTVIFLSVYRNCGNGLSFTVFFYENMDDNLFFLFRQVAIGCTPGPHLV